MKKESRSDPLSHEIIDFIKTKIEILAGIFELLRLEIKLAKQSLLVSCLLLIFIILLIMSTWLCILGTIFLALLTTIKNPLLIFIGLALFNILIIIILAFIARNYLKNLKFNATRRQLSKGLGDDHEPQKANHSV